MRGVGQDRKFGKSSGNHKESRGHQEKFCDGGRPQGMGHMTASEGAEGAVATRIHHLATAL